MSQFIQKSGMLGLLFLLGASVAHAKLQVFACEPEWSALVRELGGKHLSIYTATNNRQDPHYIQARPSLIAKARRADLLVCTGAELEAGWLPLLLRKSGNRKILAGKQGHFMATRYVRLLEKPRIVDRSMGDIHAAGNPHIQLDPARMLIVAKNLSKTLIKLDPKNRVYYQQRLRSFSAIWKKKMRYWKNSARSLKGKSIVVHHKSWVYLRKWLGIKRAGTLESRPGVPPTVSHLSKLLSELRSKSIHRIVYATSQNSKAAKWLSRKTGIPAVAVDISPAAKESLVQWFDRLIRNLLG